jgi:hypothetical protein
MYREVGVLVPTAQPLFTNGRALAPARNQVPRSRRYVSVSDLDRLVPALERIFIQVFQLRAPMRIAGRGSLLRIPLSIG